MRESAAYSSDLHTHTHTHTLFPPFHGTTWFCFDCPAPEVVDVDRAILDFEHGRLEVLGLLRVGAHHRYLVRHLSPKTKTKRHANAKCPACLEHT